MSRLRVVLIIIWTLSTLLFTVSPSPTTATSPIPTSAPLPSLTPVTAVGGLLYDAVVADGYAYLGEGRSLTIADMATPESPTIVARLPLPETIRSLALRETTAYALTSGQLVVIDISTPPNPRVQRSLEVGLAVGGSGEALTIQGNYAYVAAGYAGLLVLDIQIADQPAIVGQLAFGEQFMTDLAVQGTTAYLTYREFPADAVEPRGGVQIVDITTPTTPTALHTHLLPHDARLIAIHDSIAYVGYRFFDTFVQVLDVSNPAAPQVRQTWQEDNVWITALAVDATTLVMNSHDGIAVADRAADGTFTVETNLALPYFPDVLILDQPWLYAGGVDTTMGFSALNLTTPTRPQIASTMTFPGIGNEVVMEGSTIYYGGSGLQVLDVSQPRTPRIRGDYAPEQMINDLVVQHQQIYLATNAGFEIVDARNQQQLVRLGQAPIPGYATTLTVADQTAYIAVSGGVAPAHALYIYDIQDQTIPRQHHVIPLPDTASHLAIIDQYVYVLITPRTADDTALVVIDRQSTPPTIVDTLNLPAGGETMAVLESRLYVGGFNLDVVDIRNPAQPQLETTVEQWGSLSDLAIWEGHLYGLAGQRGIVHIPLVNGQPQPWRALNDQPAWGRAFAIRDSLVATAEWDAGLSLFQTPQTTNAVFLPLVRR